MDKKLALEQKKNVVDVKQPANATEQIRRHHKVQQVVEYFLYQPETVVGESRNCAERQTDGYNEGSAGTFPTGEWTGRDHQLL